MSQLAVIKMVFAACTPGQSNIVCGDSLPNHTATKSDITSILGIVFAILGALAFLMTVIGGLRYIVAQGDPNKVGESKKMIVYSIVGMVVAASAWAVVSFVLGAATK